MPSRRAAFAAVTAMTLAIAVAAALFLPFAVYAARPGTLPKPPFDPVAQFPALEAADIEP